MNIFVLIYTGRTRKQILGNTMSRKSMLNFDH